MHHKERVVAHDRQLFVEELLGLPQFLHSAFAINFLFASNASAIFKSIVWLIGLLEGLNFCMPSWLRRHLQRSTWAQSRRALLWQDSDTVVSVEALPPRRH